MPLALTFARIASIFCSSRRRLARARLEDLAQRRDRQPVAEGAASSTSIVLRAVYELANRNAQKTRPMIFECTSDKANIGTARIIPMMQVTLSAPNPPRNGQRMDWRRPPPSNQ